jgi:hypothetical protein
MRELELLGDYLLKLRRERLEMAHAEALVALGDHARIRIYAHEAELCHRIHAAVKQLAHDPGKFIKDHL